MNAIVPYSDSDQQPSVFNFNGHDVRIFLIDGADWWVAADVCDPLDIANVSKAVSRLDDDEKTTITLSDSGRPVKVLLVNEPGLYSLIGSSRKPEAKVFKRWVNHEVLPSIRKTGKYELAKPASQLQVLEQMMAVFSEQQRQLEAIDRKQAEQAMQIESITDRLDDADYYTVLQWCIKQRIANTDSIRRMWGKAATALSSANNIEIKSVIEGKYPVNRYHKSVLLEVCVAKPKSNPDQPTLFISK
jgi:anti-repressor protein